MATSSNEEQGRVIFLQPIIFFFFFFFLPMHDPQHQTLCHNIKTLACNFDYDIIVQFESNFINIWMFDCVIFVSIPR